MRSRLAVRIVALALLVGTSGCLAAKILAVVEVGWLVGGFAGSEIAVYSGYTFDCSDSSLAEALVVALEEKLGRKQLDPWTSDDHWYLHSTGPENHHVLVEYSKKSGKCRASVLIEGNSGLWLFGGSRLPEGEEDRIPEVVEARNAIEQVLTEWGVSWTYARWELWHAMT